MTQLRVASVLLMLSLTFTTYAQTVSSPVVLSRSDSWAFTSKVNGRPYRIYISLPASYSQNPTTRYPVVYVTDANLIFGVTAQTYGLLRYANQVPDLVLVGIAHANTDALNPDDDLANAERMFDLSPTRDMTQERLASERYKREVKTGGGADFLRVFLDELIPDVDRRYRTTPDRTFIGYSLGGLFGAYAVFQSPDTFRRAILVSPSLFWNENVTGTFEAAYAVTHAALRLKLFMSAGEAETGDMIGGMRRMATTLAGRRYEGLELQTRIFEGEVHNSTFPVAVTRGLRAVFAGATP